MTTDPRDLAAIAGIDWSRWGAVTQTVDCRCSKRFRSHYKAIRLPTGGYLGVSEQPCPGCGSHTDGWHVVSDTITDYLEGA